MPRILRSQGIYKLFPPIAAAPAAPPVETTIRSRMVAVDRSRRDQKRRTDPSYPWVTQVQSGYVRAFSRPPAAGENIQLAAPPSAGFGTLLALVHRRSTETHAALSFTVAGPSASTEFYIGANPSNNLRLWDGSTDSQSSITLTESEGWALIAVTKATGSATPRFHKCVLSSGAWTHSDATTGAIGNWSISPTAAWFGTSGDGFDGFQGQIAAAAYWSGDALADATLETLTSIAQIARANPTALWSLNQPSVSVSVQDVIGTADQTGISGTVVQSAQIPNFNTDTPLGSTVPMIGLRPPMVIGPGPNEDQITLGRSVTRTRPRHTIGTALRPPATLEPWSVALRERTILTRLVRTRPRPTTKTLRPPATLEPWSIALEERTTRTWIVRGRPGKTITRLFPARVVQVPSVLLEQQTIRTQLVRGRAGKTDYRLFPPTVVAAAVTDVFYGPRSTLVRTRPRRTRYFLEPPTVLQVFSGPTSRLTKARPRPTAHTLRPPQVVRVPAVEQEQQTIRVVLVRGRPGKTMWRLEPPTVVRVPSVEQQQQTIRKALVRTRPRATHALLRPPTAIVVNPPVDVTFQVKLVTARPRRTGFLLRPPVFYKAKSELRVRLVRARPQPTQTLLGKPTVLLTFSTGERNLVRTRPRPTTVDRRPPAVVREQPAVTQIRAALTNARPRPTTRTLRPPAVLRVFDYGRVVLTRIRPRHTIARLFPPTVVEPFREPVATFIRKWLVRIRPPHTQARLEPPKGAPHVPGVACLIDVPANVACLIDQLAAEACLRDDQAAQGCLTDTASDTACLVDQSADRAILRDEEA